WARPTVSLAPSAVVTCTMATTPPTIAATESADPEMVTPRLLARPQRTRVRATSAGVTPTARGMRAGRGRSAETAAVTAGRRPGLPGRAGVTPVGRRASWRGCEHPDPDSPTPRARLAHTQSATRPHAERDSRAGLIRPLGSSGGTRRTWRCRTRARGRG